MPEEAISMNIQGYNTKDKSKAKKIFENCIAKYPNFEWPYLNLGSIYLNQGNTAKAEELLTKTLSINPDSVEGLCLLAETKRREKDFAGATKYINQALERDPDDPRAKLLKALPAKPISLDGRSW